MGDAKDIQEAVTGKDLITGKKLTGGDRALTITAAVLPVVSGPMLKGAAKGGKIAVKEAKELFGNQRVVDVGNMTTDKVDSSGGNKKILGSYYDTILEKHKQDPEFFSHPDNYRIVQGTEYSRRRAEYTQMVNSGELTETALEYYDSVYGSPSNPHPKRIAVFESNGKVEFGKNPLHTEATTLQQNVHNWQKEKGYRRK